MHKRLYATLLISALLLMTLALGVSQIPSSVQAQAAFDCSNVTGVPVADCEGLVALYNATDGESWTNKTTWLQTNTPCTWYGVSCSGDRVSWLSLYDNRLAGALPPEIGSLTALTWLNLDGNQLASLPTPIGNLTALTGLGLKNNLLTSLPATVGGLTQVRWINLSNNLLTSLPA